MMTGLLREEKGVAAPEGSMTPIQVDGEGAVILVPCPKGSVAKVPKHSAVKSDNVAGEIKKLREIPVAE